MNLLLLTACVVTNLSVGPVRITCAQPGSWQISAQGASVAPGLEEIEVRLASSVQAPPPAFSVRLDIPQLDACNRWTADLERVTLPPPFWHKVSSRLSNLMPVVAMLNDRDANRLTLAVSEAKRDVTICAGVREEESRLEFSVDFFTEPESPLGDYVVHLRLDRRDTFFGESVNDAVRWIERTAKLTPSVPPPSAFDPLYSTWYAFHQNVTDRAIEAECAEAARLGMKTLIVDDGWQTDDNRRGYAYCGDWQISKRRFPDMAAHVKRVHALGLKYMIWYGVPQVGYKSAAYRRFKGKFLWQEDGRQADYASLDPRFPEVRKYLADLYEQAAREWDLDGLKLDFIDAFFFRYGRDPAQAENYAGRDVTSLQEAVDRLLKDVTARLRAFKPDFLIEFRQSYVGPAVRQYGNMLRAADCAGDLLANRVRIANLRLTSGTTAVHSDMLEWNRSERVERAARFVLASLFATIQYSMMLRDLPEDHRRMMRHWLDFSQRHRDALLQGGFRPHGYAAFYPWIEAWNASERLIAVYSSSTVADLGEPDREIYVLDGTGTGRLVLRAQAAATAECYDTFGKRTGVHAITPGLNDVTLPGSGYLCIRKR